jgi:uncharacterized membrane protein
MGLFNWKPFSDEESLHLETAISEAEKETSGEIRVHIDRYCKTDPIFKAGNIFSHLNMHETKERNGVLIYVAIEDHKFAIIGDKGIHDKVGDDFWQEEKQLMLEHFKKSEYSIGLEKAIIAAGEKLKMHFPAKGNNPNELRNDITFGSDL